MISLTCASSGTFRGEIFKNGTIKVTFSRPTKDDFERER